MKMSFSAFFSSPPVLVFLGIFIFAAMLFGDPFHLGKKRTEWKWRERNDKINPFLKQLRPPDTISHKQGEKAWDSILHIYQYQDRLNYFVEDYYDAGITPFLVYHSDECTRCDEIGTGDFHVYPESDRSSYYYIGLRGFMLKENRYFLRDNNTNFIFYYPNDDNDLPVTNADTALKKLRFYKHVSAETFRHIHSVPYRYDYWNQTVLIPVSKRTYKTLNTINVIAAITFGLYLLVILINVPYRIIRNIAQGKAFHLRTIQLVDFLAYNFLLFPFVVFIYRYIIHLLFAKYITADLRSTALKELLGSGIILYIGLLLFALGVALKKGFKLQREQDLTI